MRMPGRGRGAHVGSGGANVGHVLPSWGRRQGRSFPAGPQLKSQEKGTQGFVQTLTAAVWAPHVAQQNKRFSPDLGFVITYFIRLRKERSSVVPQIKKKVQKLHIKC